MATLQPGGAGAGLCPRQRPEGRAGGWALSLQHHAPPAASAPAPLGASCPAEEEEKEKEEEEEGEPPAWAAQWVSLLPCGAGAWPEKPPCAGGLGADLCPEAQISVLRLGSLS